MEQKRNLIGWAFLLPATILIFYILLLPHGTGADPLVPEGYGQQCTARGFCKLRAHFKGRHLPAVPVQHGIYFVIQVPIMLILALVLAQLLNSPDLKGKGIYRTMIFLPCATSLVSYSMIFKSLFANDGLVNRVLSTVGIPTVDWFQNAWAARWVHRYCAGLALDGLQHGVLSGRPAEH